VRFYIHGDGPLRDIVDRAAATNPSLIKAAMFSHDQWREALCRYDILLLPSVSGEGMPMVILEAMALGIVPIATPIASIPEIIEDGTRGLLVPCNDVASVVQAISRLADDRSKLKQMSDACRAYARANFDVRVASAKLLEIYRDLAGTKDVGQ
jgi:glycosyltransferase involved in cell wall biosynthesis